MAPAPTEESVTNTPSRSPAKVVSVAVHRGSGSACCVAVSRRSHRCDRTQTAVMTRAMPKAVVIRGGEALPLMPKIRSAKRVRIVAGMLPAALLPGCCRQPKNGQAVTLRRAGGSLFQDHL